jgi:hypothetical protein
LSTCQTFAQQLHSLLEQTSAPDTAIIQQATTQLNTQFYKTPECIPALYEIVATSPRDEVRARPPRVWLARWLGSLPAEQIQTDFAHSS